MERNITGRGVMVGCVALVMLVVGLIFGSGELITLGVCALLMVGGCFVLAPLNLRNLELRVQLPPRFFAARRVGAVVELQNRGTVLDAWGIDILLRFPHKGGWSGHAGWTPAQGSSILKERLSIPGRAMGSQLEYEIRSGFPLGLFEVSKAASCPCPFLVYPKPIAPVELQLEGIQAHLNPIAGLGSGDLSGEPRGIRPYQPGDKAARIHQFASARSIARGQGLQVRADDPPGYHPEACRIVFHSLTKVGEVIRHDRFERALSLVAGTLAHYQSTRTKVILQADFNDWQDFPCGKQAQYLECLALLSRARRAPQVKSRELPGILQRVPGKESLIIISDSEPEHWSDLVGAAHRGAVLIDIRQVRFKRRNIQFQPADHP